MGVLNYQIDLHGMDVMHAKKQLEKLLSSLPNQYGQITVIHGYQTGSSLQIMVRTQLKHRRIRQKILSLNQGETILLLNEKTASIQKKNKKKKQEKPSN